MLRAKNDYRWPDLIEKAITDKTFEQRLISKPVEVFKDYEINIPSNVEPVVLTGNFFYPNCPIVLPLQDDFDIIEPIDIWSKIVRKVWIDSSYRNDLLKGDLIQYDTSLETDTDRENSKLNYATQIKNFIGDNISLEEIISDINFTQLEDALLHIVEDTVYRKHFILPRGGTIVDVSQFSGFLYLRSSIYTTWPSVLVKHSMKDNRNVKTKE